MDVRLCRSFVISELCHFLKFEKNTSLVKQGFMERIDQFVCTFTLGFCVWFCTSFCLCMNRLGHARIGVSTLG